jgi:hypothetical protein
MSNTRYTDYDRQMNRERIKRPLSASVFPLVILTSNAHQNFSQTRNEVNHFIYMIVFVFRRPHCQRAPRVEKMEGEAQKV